MLKRDDAVGELIDAAVNTPDRVSAMVQANPQLIDKRWVHGETALHFVAVEGYEHAVRVLAQAGVDVNAKNDFGEPRSSPSSPRGASASRLGDRPEHDGPRGRGVRWSRRRASEPVIAVDPTHCTLV
jgi:hypothetical protein